MHLIGAYRRNDIRYNRKHRRNPTANQIFERLGLASIGHVDHFDPGARLEHLAEEMGRRTDSRRAVAELTRTRACISDKAIQRSHRYGGVNHNEMRRRPHHADRGEIGRGIVRQMLVQALVDGLRSVGADEQRMAIALGARRFRGREIAAGTRLVLDHNGLCKYRLEVVG